MTRKNKEWSTYLSELFSEKYKNRLRNESAVKKVLMNEYLSGSRNVSFQILRGVARPGDAG